jgi:hypothetical protein
VRVESELAWFYLQAGQSFETPFCRTGLFVSSLSHQPNRSQGHARKRGHDIFTIFDFNNYKDWLC